jgi:hypothetical protein
MHPIRPAVAVLTACLVASGFAADEATYRGGMLTIPSVNSDAQVGQYQDITMQAGENGAWELKYFASLGEELYSYDGRTIVRDTLYKLPISRVEIVKTSEVPVQVFLRVSGAMSGCASLGRATHRLVGNRFEVLLADGTTGITYAVALCTADVRSYVKTIPLSVYGLGAGTYSYVVNGEATGAFALEADNLLPGDCVGAACPQAAGTVLPAPTFPP